MGKNGGFYKQQFLKSLASYDGDFTSTIFESSVYCMSNFVQYFNNVLPWCSAFIGAFYNLLCVWWVRDLNMSLNSRSRLENLRSNTALTVIV